jgi:transposase
MTQGCFARLTDMGAQRFREYNPDQDFLLPPSLREWLPSDHLANFIGDVVERLDLSEVLNSYDNSQGGQAPFHPVLMTKLVLYAYCVGIASSRRIERSTYESIPFRVLAANQHPDHDTIAEFRKYHLVALSRIFLQVLKLCQKAGLVKLGHVALDGTKVKANASKHKAMSYGHMQKKTEELEAEIEKLLAEAEAVDKAEDARYGKGKRGDELPEELSYRERRLAKIQEAKQALEEEARQESQAGHQGAADKPKAAKPMAGSAGRVKPEAQRNFTDPDSRIMRDGATKAFEQAYNGQVAVDSEHQIIVAAGVTQECNDKQQVEPMVERMKANLGGACPRRMTLDNGYYSDENVGFLKGAGIDAYIATGRLKHCEAPPPAPRGRIPKGLTEKERMARKLRTVKGRCIYAKRKEIAEPVIGQVKEARGFRRFLLRGSGNVDAEWLIICLTHNLLKLFRKSWQPALAG